MYSEYFTNSRVTCGLATIFLTNDSPQSSGSPLTEVSSLTPSDDCRSYGGSLSVVPGKLAK